ncbi:thioredoxin family protein [Oligoflexia bacterium]|nr:thioredoxin family protein [Oligoflexia bacterium]
MSLTPSTMLPLGTIAPEFSLPDTVSGEVVALSDLKSDIATVIMFICNHCPYVVHVRDELVKLGNDYLGNNISFVAISSNDADTHPDDAPDKMKALSSQLKFPFPYLYDESQAVAKAYHAACTPDFYLFDKDLKLVYRGQLDDSRPGNSMPVTGVDLRDALDAILGGRAVSSDQKPSVGCNIKWKS